MNERRQTAVGIAQTESCERLGDDAVGLQESLDQQDRADGDEDVLAEEQRRYCPRPRRAPAAEALRFGASVRAGLRLGRASAIGASSGRTT